MYNSSLIVGLVFSVYIIALAFIAVKKRRNDTVGAGDVVSGRFPPRFNEREELIRDIHISDNDGKTIITWTPPVAGGYVATKVYLRVSNNPVAAVSRYEIQRSDNKSESITHNRNGSRFWYWITLVYADGTESEKQFIDVIPNSDD